MKRSIRSRLVCEFSPPNSNSELISVSISPRGYSQTAWTHPLKVIEFTPRTDDGPDRPSFPCTKMEKSAEVVFVEHDSSGNQTTHLPHVNTPFATFHRTPKGILVVGARAEWKPSGPDQNAILLNNQGKVLTTACFGDGIQHTATTSSGACWVSYFDEGIFGNFGWGGPGCEPIGSSGIVRFNEWLKQQVCLTNCPDMADCYASVVHGESVTACYYTDWNIVELSEFGESRKWSNEVVAGAFSMCRQENSVALLGGYTKDWNRLVIGELSGDRFKVKFTGQYVMPDGKPFPDCPQVIGRESKLHLFHENRWYSIDPFES